MTKQKILVTGTAGFIGFYVVKKLLEEGLEVFGLDNINNYYDVNLKYARLVETGIEANDIKYNVLINSNKYAGYHFIKLNLEDRENILSLFQEIKFDKVCHLAAQAGVRYSIENPYTYIDCNIVGFINILEGCRHNSINHLVYASSSSVYGLNSKMPLSTCDNIDHPISLYAATKKSNELMAHAYSHLYQLPTTGLRFFSVYGPWGRPDMALFIFTKHILEDKPIEVFNFGNMVRDFTYVDDIVNGVYYILFSKPTPQRDYNPSTSPTSPYKIYNIGNSCGVNLMEFINIIEQETGKKARINLQPLQSGDIAETLSDVSDLIDDIGYKPNTSIQTGIHEFVKWYRSFYQK